MLSTFCVAHGRGGGGGQHHNLWRSSCGPILNYETIFISVGGP